MEAAIETLRPGDHAAMIYRTRAEQFSVVNPFIQSGLNRGERCQYIASSNSVPLVLEKLSKAGVDVSTAQGRGALVVLSKRETYQKHGIFEPEKMVAELKKEVETALALGFSGLRATGEMTWAFRRD